VSEGTIDSLSSSILASPDEAAAKSGRVRMLVVEGDPLTLANLATVLAKRGFDVESFHDHPALNDRPHKAVGHTMGLDAAGRAGVPAALVAADRAVHLRQAADRSRPAAHLVERRRGSPYGRRIPHRRAARLPCRLLRRLPNHLRLPALQGLPVRLRREGLLGERAQRHPAHPQPVPGGRQQLRFDREHPRLRLSLATAVLKGGTSRRGAQRLGG
jgi:hypothetical protein